MKEFAKILLDRSAVSLRPGEPFTWASGIKSPIYCDNRLLLSYPADRKKVEEGLENLVKEHFPQVEMLMGTATAGIPHAAIMADHLDLPMGFVRSSAKDHGKKNAIEGKISPNLKVVVVEDLISTGGSSLEAVNQLLAAGVDVIGVVAIFTYGMAKSKERFKEANIPYVCLTGYEELLEVAVEQGNIKAEDVSRLRAFMANPNSQDWMK